MLTIDGDYTEVGDGGMLLAEVGGTVLGDEYDQLNVTGNVSLAGTLVVRFINGFAPHAGDAFAFLHVSSAQTGAFSHVEIENLAPGFQYDLIAADGGMATRRAQRRRVCVGPRARDPRSVGLRCGGMGPAAAALCTQ